MQPANTYNGEPMVAVFQVVHCECVGFLIAEAKESDDQFCETCSHEVEVNDVEGHEKINYGGAPDFEKLDYTSGCRRHDGCREQAS